jgi:hypothetical protein
MLQSYQQRSLQIVLVIFIGIFFINLPGGILSLGNCLGMILHLDDFGQQCQIRVALVGML